MASDGDGTLLSRTTIDGDPATQWHLLTRIGLKPEQLKALVELLEQERDAANAGDGAGQCVRPGAEPGWDQSE